ncbi:hypothetical protein FDP41_005317 [Naegleria fowleri]|uniref:GAF domain-containing protein n=1 Tax=Naegleria fowleri TaxID=5763 RepID=A0A6A5BQ13_NAEFO|nr:uncharacterized protein FDP41_005317 [Naegleria fowleri]KAF0975990.1 hypothetical protein FDP41_005317 [Naegleria fowleri]
MDNQHEESQQQSLRSSSRNGTPSNTTLRSSKNSKPSQEFGDELTKTEIIEAENADDHTSEKSLSLGVGEAALPTSPPAKLFDDGFSTTSSDHEQRYSEFKLENDEIAVSPPNESYIKFIDKEIDLDKESDIEESEDEEELDLKNPKSARNEPQYHEEFKDGPNALPGDFLFNYAKFNATVKKLASLFNETMVLKAGSLADERESFLKKKSHAREEEGTSHPSSAQHSTHSISEEATLEMFFEAKKNFDKHLKHLDFRLKEIEVSFNSKLDELRQELTIAKKEKDVRSLEWKERYDKLHKRWNDVMTAMSNLQKEKEELRRERDGLFSLKIDTSSVPNVSSSQPSHQNAIATKEQPTGDSLKDYSETSHLVRYDSPAQKIRPESKEQALKMRYDVLRSISQSLLNSMAESLQSQMATVFIYNPKQNELQSFCLVCKYDFTDPALSTLVENKNISNATLYSNNTHTLSGGPKSPPKHICLPANQGIVGEVFTRSVALNVFDVPTYKKHYRYVDKETGLKTKVAICFPLISKKTNGCIGVLEVMNKTPNPDALDENEPYDIQDEAKMFEFSRIFSELIDNEMDCLPFSIFVKPQKTALAWKESKEKKEELSYSNLNVTRVYPQSTMRVFDELDDLSPQSPTKIGSVRAPSALVPKEVEEYIKKLESCWRKSVNETAQHKNTIVTLEESLNEKQQLLKTLERKNTELEKSLDELKSKMISEFKEQKLAKQEWKIKENEMRVELDFIKKTHNTLVQEHMFRLKEESIKSLLLPVNTSQISQSLENVNTLNNSSLIGRQSPVERKGELPYLDSKVNKKLMAKRPSKNTIDQTRIPSDLSERTTAYFPPIFAELFTQLPLPTLILNNKFRIWRFNNRFLSFLGCKSEQNEIYLSQLLGISFADICIGIEHENLSKLMQYDILQGLNVAKLGPENDSTNTSQTTRSPSPILSLNNTLNSSNLIDLRNDSRSPTQNILSKKAFVKVTAYVCKIGQNGQKFSTGLAGSRISVTPALDESPNSNSIIKGPLYSIIFTK